MPTDETRYQAGIDSLEATSHPFVINIWLEEGAGEAQRATWRGHITHVPSGERRYFERIDNISAFILPYLQGMGVQYRLCGRLRHRLTRWMRRVRHWH